MSNRGALTTLDDDAAIAQIASGVLTKQIAERYGVDKSSLRERLAKHPRYQQAVKEQAESIVEKVTAEALDDNLPADNPSIARARMRVETAHKWAAARDPGTWSGKVEQAAPAIVINLVSYAPQGEEHVTQHVVEHNHIFSGHQPQLQQSVTPVAQEQHPRRRRSEQCPKK